jgi:hypothetical protein
MSLNKHRFWLVDDHGLPFGPLPLLEATIPILHDLISVRHQVLFYT